MSRRAKATHAKIRREKASAAATTAAPKAIARTPRSRAAIATPVRKNAARMRDILSRRRPVGALYAVGTLERVEQVREGVPAELIQVISEEMGMTKEKLYAALRLPRATVNRKLQAKQTLSPDESERVLGVARLVGQVEAIVRESGEPETFDAARWLAEWLERPNPALGRKPPAEFLDTADGRALISDVLARMQSGAYS